MTSSALPFILSTIALVALSALVVILLLKIPAINITGMKEIRTIAILHPLVIEMMIPDNTRLDVIIKVAILLPIDCCKWLVWVYIFYATSVDRLWSYHAGSCLNNALKYSFLHFIVCLSLEILQHAWEIQLLINTIAAFTKNPNTAFLVSSTIMFLSALGAKACVSCPKGLA